LITGILLDAKGGPGFFRNFYARRTVRIMPLYFGYLILVVFLLPILELPMRNVRSTENSDALSRVEFSRRTGLRSPQREQGIGFP